MKSTSFVVLCVLLAGCGGTDTADTTITTPQAAESQSAATQAEPAPAPPPTVDPVEHKKRLLLEYQVAHNDLVQAGNETDYLEFEATHSWPSGEWTPEMHRCMGAHNDWSIETTRAVFFDMDSLVHTPDWQVPESEAKGTASEEPGSGQTPGPGTYAVAGRAGLATWQQHVHFDGDTVLMFPGGDPVCPEDPPEDP